MLRWLSALFLLAAPLAQAGIDHEWSLDQNGIWARKYQTGLETGVIAVELAGAVWLGNDDEAGHEVDPTVRAAPAKGCERRDQQAFLGRLPFSPKPLPLCPISAESLAVCRLQFDTANSHHGCLQT